MTSTITPVARAEMLIRKPVAEVFNAFVDPAVTSRFWFTRGSGKLVPGETVTWWWDMYGVSATVAVKAVEPNRRIAIEWPTPVEWTFTSKPAGTFVVVEASGFTGSDDEKAKQAIDSMGGFSLTLAACKVFLEHGIEPNFVLDHNPDALVKGA
jgi:uncharacterized protein YndB with AHSA1/START domain